MNIYAQKAKKFFPPILIDFITNMTETSEITSVISAFNR